MSQRCHGGCGREGVVPQHVKSFIESDYVCIHWCEPCAKLVIDKYLERTEQ